MVPLIDGRLRWNHIILDIFLVPSLLMKGCSIFLRSHSDKNEFHPWKYQGCPLSKPSGFTIFPKPNGIYSEKKSGDVFVLVEALSEIDPTVPTQSYGENKTNPTQDFIGFSIKLSVII